MRAKCYWSRTSEDSGRAKIGVRAKKERNREGVGQHGSPFPALFHFCSRPNFRTGTLATQASINPARSRTFTSDDHTVEALASGHPRDAKKVSVTGAGRLREWFS